MFRRLDPVALEDAFILFMDAFGRALGLGAGPSVVAIDGKSLKRAYEKGRAPIVGESEGLLTQFVPQLAAFA